MLERLGPAARRAADRARLEAIDLRHDHLGTEHLLLGIVAAGESAAAGVLHAHGVTAAALRAKVAEAVAGSDGPTGEPALTDRAGRALERAGRMSLRRGESAVGTVAVAVSVIDVEGTAGQVLRGLGTDIASLRADLQLTTDDGTPALAPPEAASPPESASQPEAASVPHVAGRSGVDGGPPPPTCGGCGAALTGGLRTTAMSARDGSGIDHPVTVVTCATCGVALAAVPAPARRGRPLSGPSSPG